MSTASNTTSINGLYKSQAKQISERFFKDGFEKIVQNTDTYDIYLKDSVSEEELENFSDMWPEFNLFIARYTKYEKKPKQ